MELHPDVVPLADLLGTWAGEGAGEYPTIEAFRYREEVTFAHVGKPFLAYRQSTVNLATGLPAHAEVGYLRAIANSGVEFVLAHPTGVTEIEEGSLEQIHHGGDPGDTRGLRLHLRSTSVVGTTTAKEVSSLERTVEVTGDILRYTLAMGAVGQPHQHHLRAELHRQP